MSFRLKDIGITRNCPWKIHMGLATPYCFDSLNLCSESPVPLTKILATHKHSNKQAFRLTEQFRSISINLISQSHRNIKTPCLINIAPSRNPSEPTIPRRQPLRPTKNASSRLHYTHLFNAAGPRHRADCFTPKNTLSEPRHQQRKHKTIRPGARLITLSLSSSRVAIRAQRSALLLHIHLACTYGTRGRRRRRRRRRRSHFFFSRLPLYAARYTRPLDDGNPLAPAGCLHNARARGWDKLRGGGRGG